MNWTDDLAEVMVFAHVLVNAGELDIARDALDCIEKPHKWEPEHELWVENGRPRQDSDAGWDEFCRGLERLAGL